MEQILLVNEQDVPVGTMEKMETHRRGILHRAFSVFIFDSKGHMLLQQRAAQKYHGAGLWTNACCSHPYPTEAVGAAAARRLQEELGFTAPLHKLFQFIYRAEVENGLIEHELDHVFAGTWAGGVVPNPAEVGDYTFMEMEAIQEALQRHPEKFTAWFRIAFPKVKEWWAQAYGHRSLKAQQA